MADPLLDALWKRVTDDWDDEKAHGAFLHHSQETAQLGEAAARYAGMKGDRDRGASAAKRLEAVAMLATTSLLAERSEPRKGVPRWLYLASAIFFGTLLAYAMARVFGR